MSWGASCCFSFTFKFILFLKETLTFRTTQGCPSLCQRRISTSAACFIHRAHMESLTQTVHIHIHKQYFQWDLANSMSSETYRWTEYNMLRLFKYSIHLFRHLTHSKLTTAVSLNRMLQRSPLFHINHLTFCLRIGSQTAKRSWTTNKKYPASFSRAVSITKMGWI